MLLKFWSVIQKVVNRLPICEKLKAAFNRAYQRRVLRVVKSTIPVDEISRNINKERFGNINSAIIWTSWWQGVESAPEYVKVAMNSVVRYKPDNYKYVVVTAENVLSYLPDFNQQILHKYNSGIISNPAFSDILRFSLLSKYGGVWMDATMILLHKEDDIFSLPLLTYRELKQDFRFISRGQWTGFFIGGKNNSYFEFIRSALEWYWLNNDEIVDYFLIDYVIRIAFERNEGRLSDLLDEVPTFMHSISVFQEHINDVNGDLSSYSNLEPAIFKGSYKQKTEVSIDGKLTLYGKLRNEVLYES